MNRNSMTQYMAAISLLMVAIIDTVVPIEFRFDILYLCCILIIFKQNTRTIIGFTVAACLLIIVNEFFEVKPVFSLSIWVNRGISILAICITSYIAIHYQKVTRTSKLKQQKYSAALKEMLFITSHQVRKPVAGILGLVEIINSYNQVTPDELKQYCQYLATSATELDNFVKELNAFISQTKKLNETEDFNS